MTLRTCVCFFLAFQFALLTNQTFSQSIEANKPTSTHLLATPPHWHSFANAPIEIYVDGDLDLLSHSGIETDLILSWIGDRLQPNTSVDRTLLLKLKDQVSKFRFGCSHIAVESHDEFGLPHKIQIPELFYLRLYFKSDSDLFAKLQSSLQPTTRDHYQLLDRTVFTIPDAIGIRNANGDAIANSLLAAIGDNQSLVFGTPAFFMDRKRLFSPNLLVGFGLLRPRRGLGVAVDLSGNDLQANYFAASLGADDLALDLAIEAGKNPDRLESVTDFKSTVKQNPDLIQSSLVTEGGVSQEVSAAIVALAQNMKIGMIENNVRIEIPATDAANLNQVLDSLVQVPTASNNLP